MLYSIFIPELPSISTKVFSIKPSGFPSCNFLLFLPFRIFFASFIPFLFIINTSSKSSLEKSSSYFIYGFNFVNNSFKEELYLLGFNNNVSLVISTKFVIFNFL